MPDQLNRFKSVPRLLLEKNIPDNGGHFRRRVGPVTAASRLHFFQYTVGGRFTIFNRIGADHRPVGCWPKSANRAVRDAVYTGHPLPTAGGREAATGGAGPSSRTISTTSGRPNRLGFSDSHWPGDIATVTIETTPWRSAYAILGSSEARPDGIVSIATVAIRVASSARIRPDTTRFYINIILMVHQPPPRQFGLRYFFFRLRMAGLAYFSKVIWPE